MIHCQPLQGLFCEKHHPVSQRGSNQRQLEQLKDGKQIISGSKFTNTRRSISSRNQMEASGCRL